MRFSDIVVSKHTVVEVDKEAQFVVATGKQSRGFLLQAPFRQPCLRCVTATWASCVAGVLTACPSTSWLRRRFQRM